MEQANVDRHNLYFYGKQYIVLILLLILSTSINTSAQDDLCVGHHWTEDEANLQMKAFEKTWDDLDSWKKRAAMIRSGIVKGMKLDQMPEIEGNFNPVVTQTRELDGYVVENIRIESFPNFYITGNLYRPLNAKGKCAAILSPHGHLQDKRLKDDVQTRCAVLARMGAIVIAYDMVAGALQGDEAIISYLNME